MEALICVSQLSILDKYHSDCTDTTKRDGEQDYSIDQYNLESLFLAIDRHKSLWPEATTVLSQRKFIYGHWQSQIIVKRGHSIFKSQSVYLGQWLPQIIVTRGHSIFELTWVSSQELYITWVSHQGTKATWVPHQGAQNQMSVPSGTPK